MCTCGIAMATQHATPATHSSNCACTGPRPNGRLRSTAEGTEGAGAAAAAEDEDRDKEEAAPAATTSAVAPPAGCDGADDTAGGDAGTEAADAATSINTNGARCRMRSANSSMPAPHTSPIST
ncbi:hypothetical protein D3C71_1880890 [compost metagenome]